MIITQLLKDKCAGRAGRQRIARATIVGQRDASIILAIINHATSLYLIDNGLIVYSL